MKDKLKSLIKEGQQFTWNTFATHENHFPDAVKPDYVAWNIKVETLLENLFGKTSPVFQNFLNSKKFTLIGNYKDQFDGAQSYIIGALNSAIDLLEYKTDENTNEAILNCKKVFIVHGHDVELKNQIEIFLNQLGLEPIVLHRQADQGQTIIEKFEANSDVSYAFVLMTPDDVTYLYSEESKPDNERRKIKVARTNVIFEFGYFIGKLGRKRVCCIYKNGVTVPTDIDGLIYKKVDKNVEEVAFSIIKDLKAIGIKLKIID